MKAFLVFPPLNLRLNPSLRPTTLWYGRREVEGVDRSRTEGNPPRFLDQLGSLPNSAMNGVCFE